MVIITNMTIMAVMAIMPVMPVMAIFTLMAKMPQIGVGSMQGSNEDCLPIKGHT